MADLRRVPLKVAGYSISVRRSQGRERVSVRIAPDVFQRLRDHFEERALQRSGERLVEEIRVLSLEPFALVCRQIWLLVRLINRRRKGAGLEPLPRFQMIPTWRTGRLLSGKPVRPQINSSPIPWHTRQVAPA